MLLRVQEGENLVRGAGRLLVMERARPSACSCFRGSFDRSAGQPAKTHAGESARGAGRCYRSLAVIRVKGMDFTGK